MHFKFLFWCYSKMKFDTFSFAFSFLCKYNIWKFIGIVYVFSWLRPFYFLSFIPLSPSITLYVHCKFHILRQFRERNSPQNCIVQLSRYFTPIPGGTGVKVLIYRTPGMSRLPLHDPSLIKYLCHSLGHWFPSFAPHWARNK